MFEENIFSYEASDGDQSLIRRILFPAIIN